MRAVEPEQAAATPVYHSMKVMPPPPVPRAYNSLYLTPAPAPPPPAPVPRAYQSMPVLPVPQPQPYAVPAPPNSPRSYEVASSALHPYSSPPLASPRSLPPVPPQRKYDAAHQPI